jgi:hypothetical protein
MRESSLARKYHRFILRRKIPRNFSSSRDSHELLECQIATHESGHFSRLRSLGDEGE